MRIVIVAPVKERAWILGEWFNGIAQQEIDVEIVCAYSKSADNTEQLLIDHGVEIIYDEEPGRSTHEIDSHAWGSIDRYAYMARLRNELIDYALLKKPDYVFSLDTDITLPKGALHQLLDYASTHSGVVAPAVNMSTNGVAWNTMTWVNKNTTRMANRPTQHPASGQVDVVMAAMLMDRKGLEAKWAAHGQGEDVGFSADAWTKQVPLWWCQEIRCPHVMRRF